MAIEYYLGGLYLQLMVNQTVVGRDSPIDVSDISVTNKTTNLETAKTKVVNFLVTLKTYNILSKEQSSSFNSFKNQNNPTYEEMMQSGVPPATKRAQKIQNYRFEKEMAAKLSILDQYYNEEEESFEKFDEETVRSMFTDQLRYLSVGAFSLLELIAMELKVLSQREEFEQRKVQTSHDIAEPQKPQFGPDGYTSRLESVPQVGKHTIGQLVDKQGKILQPFVISNRQDLQKKVQGTGQVLPSMTVDEYLDYELANGKMMKEEVNDQKNEDDTDNSDEEFEKRKWDDWKDDNPKGSGNTMRNVG